jgi:hypothetical protein
MVINETSEEYQADYESFRQNEPTLIYVNAAQIIICQRVRYRLQRVEN